jgi:arylsulfatase A-like enzyme
VLVTTDTDGHRISPIGAALFAAALVLVAASKGAQESAAGVPEPRPNIVVLMTDDQTVESLRVMTNVRRALATQGTTFPNSFASFPTCCPSRATFLTGQYAHNHLVMGNHPPLGGAQSLDHFNTLALWLQAAGYRTVHVGKYLNGYGKDETPFLPAGWSEWYASLDPSTYSFANYTLNENGTEVTYRGSATSYQTDVYGRKGAELVRRLAPREEPFFLFVGFLAAHVGQPREPGDPRNLATPVPAPRHKGRFAGEALPRPPSFNEADVSDKPLVLRRRARLTSPQVAEIQELYQQRLESLLAADEAIARIVSALRTAGELARTLIVFTSDNGFLHGEHRVPQGKVVVYEPSVRVPLILRGPGVARNRIQRDLVANVDLAATIVDAADAFAARLLDGRSLLPLAEDPDRRFGRDILLETSTYSAIRTPRYKYVEYRSGARELYDLAHDPHELRSLHRNRTFASIGNELAQRLARLRNCGGRTCSLAANVRLTLRGVGAESCVRSVAAVGVGGRDATKVARAEFRLAGRRLVVRRRAPFTAGVSRQRLTASGRLLRVALRFADGRELTLDRQLRAC